jgi:polar amino acid transport system substrate-binding protein
MSGLLLRLRRRHGLSFSLLALLSLVLLACGEEPGTPPDLTGLSPAFPEVVANQTIEIEVLYTANDDPIEDFRWTIDSGRIDDEGKAKITYHAPGAPGDYRLRVVAIYGTEPGQEAALDGFVRVLPPRREVASPDLQQARRAATTRSAAATEAPPAQASQDAATVGTPPSPQQAERPTSSQPATAAAGLSRVDKIERDKRFTAIIEDDFEPFSFEEDGKRVGFDVDLVREFARRWLEDPGAARLLPATTEQRIPILLHGRGDLIAAALTRTPEREEQIDFSTTYFKDGQRLLVEDASKVTGVCDLNGRKVAVIRSSTSAGNIVKEARACGFDLEPDLVQVQRQEQALELLMRDEVAAFTSDGIALQNAAKGRPFKIVGNHFSDESYGIGIPKGDERLRELIDRTLAEMSADGTLAAIYRKWFGDEIRPYPLEASVDQEADQTLLAMATTDAPVLMEPVEAPPPPNEYVVQAGDTLSKVAGKVYGDVGPEAWRRIYDANREAIGADPSALKVGMKLTIPPA